MSKVELHLGASPGDRSVTVDGHDIGSAVTSLQVSCDARGVPSLVLRLDVAVTHITGEMDVRMPAATAALLEHVGWTPPKRVEAIAFESPAEPERLPDVVEGCMCPMEATPLDDAGNTYEYRRIPDESCTAVHPEPVTSAATEGK